MSQEHGALVLGKGFSDPVLGSQRCFRGILAAMSEPGTVQILDETIEAPEGVTPAAAMVLLTLADHETPVWLAPHYGSAAQFVRFHCGAPVTELTHQARFALLDGAQGEPGFDAFGAGDDRYPDRSATLIVQCLAFDGGTLVRLSGPGIQTYQQVAPLGLHKGFWQQAISNSERYPLGLDLILAAGDAILAVPRTTRVAVIAETC